MKAIISCFPAPNFISIFLISQIISCLLVLWSLFSNSFAEWLVGGSRSIFNRFIPSYLYFLFCLAPFRACRNDHFRVMLIPTAVFCFLNSIFFFELLSLWAFSFQFAMKAKKCPAFCFSLSWFAAYSSWTQQGEASSPLQSPPSLTCLTLFEFSYLTSNISILALMNNDKANINQSVFKLSMEILKELERDGFPSSSGSYCGITFFLFRIEHNFLLLMNKNQSFLRLRSVLPLRKKYCVGT